MSSCVAAYFVFGLAFDDCLAPSLSYLEPTKSLWVTLGDRPMAYGLRTKAFLLFRIISTKPLQA